MGTRMHTNTHTHTHTHTHWQAEDAEAMRGADVNKHSMENSTPVSVVFAALIYSSCSSEFTLLLLCPAYGHPFKSRTYTGIVACFFRRKADCICLHLYIFFLFFSKKKKEMARRTHVVLTCTCMRFIFFPKEIFFFKRKSGAHM